MPKKSKRKKLHPPHYSFKAFLVENNIRLKEIADLLKTDVSAISQKNNGYQNYSMVEVDLICNHYGISADTFRFKKVS